MTDTLRPQHRHRWDVSPCEAIQIQRELREHVVVTDEFGKVKVVSGVDVGFEEGGATTRAAVAVLGFPQLDRRAYRIARRATCFPYVPGLLSFRELPAVLDALAALERLPDLLLCDAHGRAHPRRFGLACHLGVVTGIPSIGVAKTRLIGTHDPVPEPRGAWQPLLADGEIIGAVVRTRRAVAPVYVSIGHRVSLASAVALVLACAPNYRLPETTRWADQLASCR
jgi:deoxyribonuclease V